MGRARRRRPPHPAAQYSRAPRGSRSPRVHSRPRRAARPRRPRQAFARLADRRVTHEQPPRSPLRRPRRTGRPCAPPPRRRTRRPPPRRTPASRPRPWNVAASVTTTSTGRCAVNGWVASLTIFEAHSFAVYVEVDDDRARADEQVLSIAPPTPSTGLPGTARFATQPRGPSTCSAPSTATSTCPPEIIPNDAELREKIQRPRAGGHPLLACVHQVRIGLAGAGGRTDPQRPVLGLQRDRVPGQVVSDEGRDADAQVSTTEPGGISATARAAIRSSRFMPETPCR